MPNQSRQPRRRRQSRQLREPAQQAPCNPQQQRGQMQLQQMGNSVATYHTAQNGLLQQPAQMQYVQQTVTPAVLHTGQAYAADMRYAPQYQYAPNPQYYYQMPPQQQYQPSMQSSHVILATNGGAYNPNAPNWNGQRARSTPAVARRNIATVQVFGANLVPEVTIGGAAAEDGCTRDELKIVWPSVSELMWYINECERERE